MSAHPSALALRCPKLMEFGPCGGLRDDHGCEVDGHRCPFLADAWAAAPPEARAVPMERPAGPLVLADVRIPGSFRGDVRAAWRRAGEVLAGCDVLLGEHVDNLPRQDDAGAVRPSAAVELLAAGGARPIVTVTGRDRDVSDAASAVRELRAAGALAIHCVTGDHPHALGLDRPSRFGAESTTLAALATELGVAVTVAESPASPGDRVGRLLAKQRAGASVCVLNHGGGPDRVVAFVDACRGAGVTLDFVAPVPMVSDARSAGALARFPGLHLPPGYLDSIVGAAEPARQGLANAEDLTRQLAASGRFVGINLSGSARDHDPFDRLQSTAEFVDACRRSWESATVVP